MSNFNINRKLLVILITYNINNKIIPCLKSLENQTQKDFDLLIIDNNSVDNTLNIVRKYISKSKSLFKKTIFIKNNINVGFAKAVNIGLKLAIKKNNYFAVLLINQDTSFDVDLLEKGVNILITDDCIGACSSKILYSDNKIFWIGTKIYSTTQLITRLTYGISEHINKGEDYKFNRNKVTEVEAICGCAMFIKTEAIKKVGLFDESYFMYAEDVDYSLRLKSNGYRLMLFNTSTVIHITFDRDKTFKSIMRSSKKYRIYLKSMGIFLLNHQPFYVFLIWIIKLPLTLTYQYIKQRNKITASNNTVDFTSR